jgi:microcystin degradation protein MlrC
MVKILLAECKQEVSSFNPVPSGYDDFTIARGQEIINFHRGGRLEMSGAISVFEEQEEGVDLVPTYSARARTSAGTLRAGDFKRITKELLNDLRSAQPVGGDHPLDGIYFCLHGAMSAENEHDPEGFLLSELRQIVGASVPIVISLDLHAVLTDRMLNCIDGVTVYHTYPHRDEFDTGARAARLLLRILNHEVKPITARVFIPALVRGDELITDTGRLGDFIRRAQSLEKNNEALAAAMIIGNPFTDVPDLGCNALVTTDNDPERAQEEALELASDFWRIREKLQAKLTPLEQAVQIAEETPGTVILTDAADATSSGAPGDSNAILRALLRAGYKGRALLPIVDAAAVSSAKHAGIGGTVRIPIGGSLDSGRFESIQIEGSVRMLSEGRYVSEYSGTPTDAGNTAVIQVGTLTLAVTSRPVSLTDRSLFFAHGLDPHRFDAVVVKSPHCRHEYFDAWASRVVNVDAPGSTSANLRTLGHKKCSRPMFPLDDGATFNPRAKIYNA